MDAEDTLFLLYTSGTHPSRPTQPEVTFVSLRVLPGGGVTSGLHVLTLVSLRLTYPGVWVGSTGLPKGVAHTTGGYLLYAAMTHQLVFDYRDGDIYCCVADIGYVSGPPTKK